MPDEIRRLSRELARDPASLAFIPLADALRRAGDLDLARRIAVRGLERHPYHGEAHDLLARIHADRGELVPAADEWGMALQCDASLVSAMKGLGFVAFRRGDLAEAERWLGRAVDHGGEDASVTQALALVRRERGASPAPHPATQPTPAGAEAVRAESSVGVDTPHETPAIAPASAPAAPPLAPRGARALFAPLLAEAGQTAILLDEDGLVLAGAYIDAAGRDIAEEIGAELSGVSAEAERAMRHLGLGAWTSLQVEAEAAIVAMSPAPHGSLLLVAVARETPVGLVRVLLERAQGIAREWLGRLA
jgi:predicted regulator of Ras-like GTPase activity (Roadblock/LC7/MglB family)